MLVNNPKTSEPMDILGWTDTIVGSSVTYPNVVGDLLKQEKIDMNESKATHALALVLEMGAVEVGSDD